MKDSASQLFLWNEGEPTFDHVDPRRTSGREMQMKSRALDQQGANSCGLVSSIIVEDKVNIKSVRHRLINLVEKFAKLNRTMAAMKLANDLARFCIERCKQRGGAIARVIMRSPLSLSRSHRKNGLRSVQRLDLCLLIHAQNQGLVRRVHVKPDDIANLVDKQRIFRKLKSLGSVGRETKRSPNAVHATVAQSARFGQRARAPVSSILGRGLQCHCKDSLDFFIAHLSWRAWPRVIQQTVESFLQKTTAPFSNHLLGDSQPRRHLGISFPISARQDYPCTQGERLSRLWSSSPLLKSLSFLFAHGENRNWSSSSHRCSSFIPDTKNPNHMFI